MECFCVLVWQLVKVNGGVMIRNFGASQTFQSCSHFVHVSFEVKIQLSECVC